MKQVENKASSLTALAKKRSDGSSFVKLSTSFSKVRSRESRSDELKRRLHRDIDTCARHGHELRRRF